MDVTFKWTKIVYHLLSGRVLLYATVPAPGFDILCSVTPTAEHNRPYSGQVRAKLRVDYDTSLWSKAHTITRTGNDAADVIAEVEAFVRAELAKCFDGEVSICDTWRADLARITMNVGAQRAGEEPEAPKPTREEPRPLRFEMSEHQRALWRKAYFEIEVGQ